ncbi:MAG: hypothetical protein AB7O24_27515 [Kofleriaceae bacterium]
MSYVHCPTCRNAYNVETSPSCPTCPVHASLETPDPAREVVAAAEQLARAMARASTAEIARAEAELDDRAELLGLPSGGDAHTAPAPSLLRAVRAAMAPPPPQQSPRAEPELRTMLTSVVMAMLTRLPKQRPSMRAWASNHVLPRVRAARALLTAWN